MTRLKPVLIDLADQPHDPFEFLLHVTRRYGDAVQYSGPVGKTYLFNAPTSIGSIFQNLRLERTSLIKLVLGESLLSSDGPYWKKQRQRAQPYFSQVTVQRLTPLIQDRTRVVLGDWADRSARGAAFDIAGDMTRLTAAIIIDALFAVDLGPGLGPLCDALDVLLCDIGDMACTQLNTPLRFTPTSRERFGTALATFDDVVAEIIDQRRRVPADPDNFLSFLLAVRDEQTGELLNPRQVRDEVAALLIAGHETTALVLSWTWYLLSHHPDAERALHQELDHVLNGRLPSVEDLGRLPYTMMVLRESMRLYPPVWMIARKAVGDVEVAGYLVNDGALVLVSPYTIHRHPKWWPEPDRIQPDAVRV